jgi:hypothetical protein
MYNEIKKQHGFTPLHLAVGNYMYVPLHGKMIHNTYLVELLIKYGADVNARNSDYVCVKIS